METLSVEAPEGVAVFLRARASADRKPVEPLIGEMLARQVENEISDFDPATVEAIREGIADAEAGREQPLGEYIPGMIIERTKEGVVKISLQQLVVLDSKLAYEVRICKLRSAGSPAIETTTQTSLESRPPMIGKMLLRRLFIHCKISNDE